MRGRWIAKGLVVFALIVLVAIGVTYALMELWNWLVPDIVGWKQIGFGQALGLLVLCRILFGFRGFGFGHRGHWRGRMMERWSRMTPEEREKFRAGMHGRWGHHYHRDAPPDAAGTAQ